MSYRFLARLRRLVLATLCALAGPALADPQIMVKIDGFAKGDSTREGYDGWYELEGSATWLTYGVKSGNQWRAQAGDLLLSRRESKDSLLVPLLQDLAESPHPPHQLDLHLLRVTDKATYSFYRVQLQNARIIAVYQSASGPDSPSLDMILSYDRFKVEYHFEDSKIPAVVGGLGALGGLVLTGGSPLVPVTAFADFSIQQLVTTGASGAVTNEPPSVSSVSNLSWVENHDGIVTFFANAPGTRPQDLQLSALASNPLLIPDTNFVFTHVGTNAFRLAMTPLRNTSGQSDIILRASNGARYAENRFHVTVTPGAKAPQISPTLRATRMNANQSLTVPFAIIDLDTPVTNLVLTVTSSNTNLFPQASMAVTSTSTFDRNLILTPPAGLFGEAAITLSLTDGEFTTTQTFSIAVNGQLSGAPTNITAPIEILDLLREGIPTGTILGALTVTDPTPGDSHVLTMLDGAEGRFGITNNNQLVVTSGGARLNRETPGFNGLFNVLVMATDLAGNRFTRLLSLPLVNVNDAPAFRYFKSPWFITPGIPSPVPTVVATDEDAGFVYPVRLTLASTGGVVNVITNSFPANTFTVTGNGSANVVVHGKITPMTSLLSTTNNVWFSGNPGYSGPASVTLTINDLNSLDTTAIGDFPDFIAQSTSLVIEGFVQSSLLATWSHDQHGNDIYDLNLKPVVWGDTVDRDGDGYANLLEYGLGYSNGDINTNNALTASTQSASAALPGSTGPFVTVGAEVGGATHNIISFIVREDPRLLSWVEAANRLTPLPDWSADVSQIALLTRQSLGNGFERLTFRDPDPNKPYRVYRLGMSYLPNPVSGL